MSRQALSLERKLPLLITALLAVILAIAVGIAYREVRRSAEMVAVERLDRASRQLAALAGASIRQRSVLLRRATADPTIRAALIGGRPGTDPAVRRVLDRLLLPSDTTLPVELWTASGAKIAVAGSDSGGAIELPIMGAPRVDAGSRQLGDTAVRYGAFFVRNGRTYFWTVAPVTIGRTTVGWIAQQGRVAAGPETARRINALIGGGSTVLYRNTADSTWVTLDGVPIAAPDATVRPPITATGPAARDSVSYTRSGTSMLAGQAAIAGTPWAIMVEAPRSEVIAYPRALLRRLLLIGVVLLVVGAVTAWVISRRLTGPIAALTEAASSLAHGDYGVRVGVDRSDEVGRLAASFNAMAGDVAAAHTALEQQFREARTLAGELEVARAAAVAASRAKSNFLATMSHEIRTPINAILGYTELMELGLSGPITDDQRSQLARIHASTQHLLMLVNELLDLARIESGAIRVEVAELSVRAAVAEAISFIGPQASALDLTVTVPPAPAPLETVVCLADEQRVRQILTNLLSNAVKFTQPGGEVTVTWTLGDPPSMVRRPDAPAYVGVHVRDTGIGIADDALRRLFQPFVQLESAGGNPYTRERSGTGLGLFISRELAQLMGGDISVESRAGRGSTFTLWLPIAPSSAATAVPPRQESAPTPFAA